MPPSLQTNPDPKSRLKWGVFPHLGRYPVIVRIFAPFESLDAHAVLNPVERDVLVQIVDHVAPSVRQYHWAAERLARHHAADAGPSSQF